MKTISSQGWLALPLILAGACSGEIGDLEPGAAPSSTPGTNGAVPNGSNPLGGSRPGGPSTTTPPLPPATPASCLGDIGPAPLRRLTKREYNNTIRDLLGDDSGPAKDFTADGTAGAFESNVETPISTPIAHDYLEAAEATAARANLDALLPCKPAAGAEEGCVRQFISAFGKRALRRPLADAEVTHYFAIYGGAKTRGHDFAGGVRVALQAMLMSPHFLNHVEVGTPTKDGAALALTPHEVASRLSYFFWQSMPDAALFQAAETGKLLTGADIEREARRMLALPKTREGVMSFYKQWLELEKVAALTKDQTRFPLFSMTLGPALAHETETFVDHVIWNGDSKLSTLLTASFSFANAEVAKLYGLTGVAGSEFRRVNLNAKERAGLLTQPSFLASHAYSDQTSPVHRGKFVRENLLCQVMPSPPPEVNVTIPPVLPNQSTRERYAVHEKDAFCWGCHKLMNPIGLSMENYDAIGVYRTSEGSLPVDGSGELVQAGEIDGKYNGLVELTALLARSAQVRDCMAKSWFGYALGRRDSPEDQCSLSKLYPQFATSGGDLRELMVAIAKTDGFRFRSAIAKEVCQ